MYTVEAAISCSLKQPGVKHSLKFTFNFKPKRKIFIGKFQMLTILNAIVIRGKKKRDNRLSYFQFGSLHCFIAILCVHHCSFVFVSNGLAFKWETLSKITYKHTHTQRVYIFLFFCFVFFCSLFSLYRSYVKRSPLITTSSATIATTRFIFVSLFFSLYCHSPFPLPSPSHRFRRRNRRFSTHTHTPKSMICW